MQEDRMDKEGMNFANKEERETYEFVRKLGLEIEKAKAEIKGDFVVNPEAYTRFTDVLKYCKKFVEENDGVILGVDTDPRNIHAGIEMEVPIVDVYGDGMEKLANILKKVDVLGINPSTRNTVFIDISVNNLWRVVKQ